MIATANELLQLYEELPGSLSSYMRTYYDLLQVHMFRRATFKEARYYLERYLEILILLYGDIDIPEVNKYKQLLASDLTKHPLYGVGER